MGSGYKYGDTIKSKFKVQYAKEGIQFSCQGFIEKVKAYIYEREDNQKLPEEVEEIQKLLGLLQIKVCDIVDYILSMGWFHGNSLFSTMGTEEQGLSSSDTSISNGRQLILFQLCEELSLLSRDSGNDEGGDSSVAVGPETNIDTEDPDYLIPKGLEQSALPHCSFRQPDWDNPIAIPIYDDR